jgi:hypothetical protein
MVKERREMTIKRIEKHARKPLGEHAEKVLYDRETRREARGAVVIRCILMK